MVYYNNRTKVKENQMIKKLSILLFSVIISSLLFGAVQQVADMNSFEPEFRNMQNNMNLDTKTKFEMICDKLLAPGIYQPEYFTEENIRNEIVMMFGGAVADMTEDASMFYVGYRLWEKHNGINVQGMAGGSKNAMGSVKTPSAAASSQVQKMASLDKNAQTLEVNIINLVSNCHHRMKQNEDSSKRIKINH